MIKALVQLGFIRRERSTIDRRQFDISLTEYGLATVEHAAQTIIDSGIITSGVVHFACSKWECPDTTFREVDELEVTLKRMRERLCDFATLHYPWHPDDWRAMPVRPTALQLLLAQRALTTSKRRRARRAE